MRFQLSDDTVDSVRHRRSAVVAVCLHVIFFLCWIPQTLADRSPIYTDPHYLIDLWETDEGLPENSATAMVQMEDGFLWFGTFGGLVRFDGVAFDVFRPADIPQLPSAGVVNLHLDQKQRLWVSTYGGIVTKSDDTWRTYSKDDGWVGDIARTYAERKNGDLLITTFDRKILQFSDGRFQSLPLPPGMSGQDYFGHADEQGNWWVVQRGFIGQWDGQRWVSRIDVAPSAESVWGGTARDGGLWLLQDRLLEKYQAGEKVSQVELPEMPGGVWSIHEDSEGNVWICTHDSGVCRVTPSGHFKRYGLRNGLAHNGVRFVFEDLEKNIWIGTSGGGLSRFRARRVHGFGLEAGLSNLNIKSVSSDGSGGLWIATYGGGLFRKTEGGITPVTLPDGASPNIQSVLRDRKGRVWVGVYGEGRYVIREDGLQLIPPEKTGGANGIATFEDSRGRIWFSGGQHVAMLDGDAFHTYGNEEGQPLFGISSFAETSDGTIWACNGSVFRLEESGRFVRVLARTKTTIAISLTADREGSLWVGMGDQSLQRWKDGKTSIVDLRTALSANVCGMVEDHLGYFWLATDRGIMRVLRETLHQVADGKFTPLRPLSFDMTDGLPSLHCSAGRQPVLSRDENGKIWFATLKGVAMVDPAGLKTPSISPPTVYIRELHYRTPAAEKDRGDVREDLNDSNWTVINEPLSSATLSLPPGSRHIEIHFGALSYATPQRVRYEVKLNDAPWEQMANRRMATFHELLPGDYVMQVRASNHDGSWSTSEKSIAFSITPYFWQRTWFRLAGVLLLVASGAGITAWIVHSRSKLRRQGEDRTRLVVESSPNAMIMVDGQGLMRMANRQAELIFGYDRRELSGQPIEMLLPTMVAAQHVALRNQFLLKPEARQMGSGRDLYALRKTGEEFPVEVGLTPMALEDGPHVLASITDITERRRSELESARQRNELAHLSRVAMLGELSGSLAHELNQPLASILSNAQAAQRFLAKGDADLVEVREILADIVDQDKRAGEVIRRLRLLLKKGEVQRESMDLNEVVQEVLKLVRSDLINHGITVEVELADDLPTIEGDRVQVQQVLLNLVMNACDAMEALPAARRILRVVTQRGADGGAHLRVVDAGSGIAVDSLENIFEPFVTTKMTGMGLGLAVCRTIITAHHGKLWATNNPEGGATLHCWVPPGKSVP